MFTADLTSKFRLAVSFFTPKKRCLFVILTFLALSLLMFLGQAVMNWSLRLGLDPLQLAQSYIRVNAPTHYQIELENILKATRQDVEKELQGYRFPEGISPERLIPEKGGRPLRSIIVSTWRSGSSFMGDILQSVPGTMYHFEPLHDFGYPQIKEGPSVGNANKRLRTLFACNYTDLEADYLKYGQKFPFQHELNSRLWQKCNQKRALCWDPHFLGPFCQLFPFQSMKIVRVRLNVTEELLEDKNLNVRVLLLVRDPRGTMQSRQPREWCRNHPDCWDPSHLCSDLTEDHASAVRFAKKFPKTFKVVRYEDLSLQPKKIVHEILEFLGLYMHPRVVNFLDTHTKRNWGDSMSTVRNSKWAPFHWRQDLNHSHVKDIQKACAPAMKLWGYVLARNDKHQKTFNPVLPSYQLPGMSKPDTKNIAKGRR